MKQPKYLQLVQKITRQIEQGTLQVGQPLPSYLELKTRYQVSQSTVDKAYAILETEGLITRKVGSGIYVSEPPVTGFVGLVDASHDFNRNFQYYAQLVSGMREQAKEMGTCVIMIDDPSTFDRWNELDGLVLCEAGHYGFLEEGVGQIRQILPHSLPCVNTIFEMEKISNVVADDVNGMQLLVKHLANLGHQRIGYLGRMHQEPMAHHPLVVQRFQAYRNALKNHRLSYQDELVFSPPLEFYRDYYSYGYEGMKHWFQNGWESLECTALLAHNDLTAMGMIDALKEAGLDVPGDISVTGFDDAEFFRLASYELTTVHVPLREIGREAMKVLLEKSSQPARTITLPVRLVEGRTTAAVNLESAARMAV
jgi:DNA-binding LacI/PurR family transcriptional regulator